MFDIADKIDVNIYRNNGFRLLDLPITASGKKVKKSFRKIEAKQRMSANANITPKKDLLMPIVPEPEFSNYQKANGRLNDSRIRFIDEVFWFWPGNLENDEDTAAWQHLRKREYDEFVRYWEMKNDSNVSYHNLAVFYHTISLDLYASNGSATEIMDYSKKAIYYWKKTFTSGFEYFAKDRVRKLNNPLLKESFVKELFSKLPKAILSIHQDMAQNAIKSNEFYDFKNYVELINESEFDFKVITSTKNGLLEFVIDYIESEIRDYESSVRKIGEDDYLEAVIITKNHIRTVSPLLDILSAVGQNNIKARDEVNRANTAVQNTTARYFNRLLKDRNISHRQNYLYVSLLDTIAVKYLDFELNPHLKNTIEKNSKNSKARLKSLESYVYSDSDKRAADSMCSYLKDEFKSGPDLTNITRKMKFIMNSTTSEEIADICMKILYDSFNYSILGEDMPTQRLYRRNLNMLKYETILEGA